jgi:hypothetical protein
MIFDAEFGGTVLNIHVVICNDSLRVIRMNQCRVELPWCDPDFGLLEDPFRKVPREGMYWSPKAPTLRFEREAVLNHRFGRQGRLNPGDSLDGFILGEGPQAIPVHYHNREGVDVQLAIVDERGKTYQASVRTMLDRSKQLTLQRRAYERVSARNPSRRELIKKVVQA